MGPGSIDTELEHQIRKAQASLDNFERTTSGRDLLTRLRASSPFHPWLLLRGFFLAATLLLCAASLIALALPFIHEDIAEVIGILDAATGVPLPGVIASLVPLFFLIAMGAHSLALLAARNAPLLPHEAKIHQRLVSDVKQLQAQRSVQQRMTPLSAGPRIRVR